jgi:hypothetical protein
MPIANILTELYSLNKDHDKIQIYMENEGWYRTSKGIFIYLLGIISSTFRVPEG